MIKNRLMHLSFRFCQICRYNDYLGSAMGKRIGLMEDMEVGPMVDMGQMEMT